MVPQEDVEKLFGWAKTNNLALFPIPAWSKQPTGLVRSHATDWSYNPLAWHEWYVRNGGCNFGVECGPSRLIVVDVDAGGHDAWDKWRKAHDDVKPHFWVDTPSGGTHAYFRVSSDVDSVSLRQPNLCGKNVNVRAGNGYVVAPWCRTDPFVDPHVKMRGSYRAGQPGLGIPSAPAALVSHCLPTRAGEPAIAPEEGVELDDYGLPKDETLHYSVRQRCTVIRENLEAAVPGERNEKLNLAAFALGKLVAEGVLAEWAAVEMLQESGEKIGIPRDEAKARSTIRSGLKAAPRVGRPEPKSAMAQLLAMAMPLHPVPPLPPPVPPSTGSLIPLEPLVERLLYHGSVTVLSGASGSGKTTFVASLVSASVADVRDFSFGSFGPGMSDVFAQPCAWIFASYEGGQHIRRTTEAWHVGSACAAAHPDRCLMLPIEDGCLVSSLRREVVVSQHQADRLNAAIAEMCRRHPSLPLVLVVDNVTTAVEDCTDATQAQTFMRAMKSLARQGVAVLLLAHPPKGGSSAVIGSHVWFSLADTVATIEVLKENDGEWVQWVDFGKHREAPNGLCLEVRSRRIDRPLVDLPAEWGQGNQRARDRQIRDLHVPFVSSIRVRSRRERESVEKGVTQVTEVTAKQAEDVRI